jgi:uncharacterized protein (DUF2164 family)
MGDHTPAKKKSGTASVMQYMSEIDTKMETENAALKALVKSLQDDLLACQRSHAGMATTLQTYKQQHEDMQLSIIELRAIVTSVREVLGREQYRNGALHNDVAALREQVATVDADVKAVATLREKFDTVDGGLAGVATG